MGIVSNIFPIKLNFSTFSINRAIYTPQLLNDLRKNHNETHSFFRRDNYIYISPMENVNIGIGDQTTINVEKNEEIVSSLVKHIFFRTFRKSYPEILPISFYPFRFISRKISDDLMLSELPQELINIISYKKMIEIQFRYHDNLPNCKFGALINVNYQWVLQKNCKELFDEGYDLIESNVLLSEIIPGLKGILAPDETLIGTIKHLENTNAIVLTNNGEEEFPLINLNLQKTTRNIRRYLEFKLGSRKTNDIIEKLWEKDISRLDAKSNYDEITNIGNFLSKLNYQNNDGFSFQISNIPYPIDKQFNIRQPYFLFDYNPGASHKNPSLGLAKFGPYDSISFDTKHPTILVLCHKKNRGAFSEFCGKLKEGIPSSKVFSGGMKGKYRLHDITYKIIELQNYDVSSYQSAIESYFRTSQEKPHLALIETCSDFISKKPQDNPYFFSKAYFLSLGIPVQNIKNEKIRQDDNNLQWITESIALQIYAKLGGTPWILPASNSIDHEIVIGIGSSLSRSNIYSGNKQSRLVGITTFFSGDGKYILSNRSREVEYDEYFTELLNCLDHSLKDISQEYGWKTNSTIRITFHIFKPIKNIEISVVNQLLERYNQYNIQYCFVTISNKHPYLLFNTNEAGKNYSIGKFIPKRGTNFIINSNSCLLQLKGVEDIKTNKHKFSNPVLISVHENSTFKDLNSIIQQINNFTYLSWRGFSPAQEPVSILYANLITRQLSKLRRIPSWKPELLNTLLKAKKWFL